MEPPSFEKLRSFFERIKNTGLFERLFFWRSTVAASYDAYSEFQQIQNLLQQQGKEITELTAKYRELSLNFEHRGQQLVQLQQDLVVLTAKNEELNQKMNERENVAGGLVEADKKNRDAIAQLKADLAGWAAKYDQLNQQYTEAQKTNIEYQGNEKARLHEHDLRVAGLNSLRQQLEEKLQQIAQEREDEIHSRYIEMEKTWLNHEKVVEETLRNLCRQHNIEYCDKEKFPYSGKPDNSVILSKQYVIFDAKSPKDSENLDNFPAYIKSQAQNVKKYVKGDDIKRDIFLVVPTNAITALPEIVYRIGEVRVYVIAYDSMEPIILALKKIDEYSFVEQLSPDDRENICQVIGKFVHASKRKIQIDTYFSKLFIELLENCDSSLPQNIRDTLDQIEKSEIMNPPTEQRNKMTPLPDLVKSVKGLEKEAESQEIDMTAVTKDKIEKITLHKFLE